MPFTGYRTRFSPSDLTHMQKVFDQLCVERRVLAEDREQREELAADVIRTFGHRDVTEDEHHSAQLKAGIETQESPPQP